MGIPHFADAGDLAGADAAMRIVLRPSFTPEICITLISNSAKASTLYEMLWHQPFPCTLPSIHQDYPLTEDFKLHLSSLLQAAVHEINHQSRPVIVCDGMSFDAAWHSGATLKQVSTHVAGPEVVRFIRTLIQFTYDAVNHNVLRNNLANCGMYVNLRLPIAKTLFRSSDKMNIGVFGTPDDRDDLIRQLSPVPPDE